jgi:hypothetical protein
MPQLDLRLLGGFRAFRGAADIALPTRKACGLLAYLAMPLGRPRSREELTALLWGERPEAQARTSVRQALATLRRTAAPGDFDLALEAEAECEAIGVATADARLQSFAALTAGWVLATRGDGEQGLKACQRSLDTARDPVSVAGAKCFQGYAHLEMGAPGQAIALLEDSIATCARIGLRRSEARGLVFLSQATLALGKVDHAREQAMRARAMHRDMKAAWGEALAAHALGRIALATGALEQAGPAPGDGDAPDHRREVRDRPHRRGPRQAGPGAPAPCRRIRAPPGGA